MYIPVGEQLATDQTDPRLVVPRQAFAPYACLFISVASVVLCHVGCLWVTGVIQVKVFHLFPEVVTNIANQSLH